MWKVKEEHVKLAGFLNAVVTMGAKWATGVMVSKLLAGNMEEEQDMSGFSPLFEALLLKNVSFSGVTILAVIIVSLNTLAASAMSSLAVLRSAETGRTLRRQVLENGAGGSAGADADVGHTATDLVAKIQLIEDFQAYDEHWLLFNWVRLVLCIVFTFLFTWVGGIIGLAMVVASEVFGTLFEKMRAHSHTFIEQNSEQVSHRLLDVIKNSVTIKIMGTVEQEADELQGMEAKSDAYIAKDARLRFFRDSAKTLLVAMVPPLIALATWPIISGGDAEEALQAASSVLITILLLDEGHKSLIYLSFVFDRQLAATEAKTHIDEYLASHQNDEKIKKQKDAGSDLSEHSTTVRVEDESSFQTSFRRVEKNNHGSLLLQSISLSYPNRNYSVFNDRTMSFKKGVVHGLIGESGAGKSSMMKIVADLIRPQMGTMTAWTGMKIAYVSQDQKLFARTIRENVVYGNDEPVSDEDVWKALEMANIAPFVKTLPGKLDEVLDEGEGMISGGQLQRLHLAHLFCTGKTSDLILLDECLSALDEKSRDILIDRLQEFLKGKTALVITHHSEMLRICERVHDMTPRGLVDGGLRRGNSSDTGSFRRATVTARVLVGGMFHENSHRSMRSMDTAE